MRNFMSRTRRQANTVCRTIGRGFIYGWPCKPRTRIAHLLHTLLPYLAPSSCGLFAAKAASTPSTPSPNSNAVTPLAATVLHRYLLCAPSYAAFQTKHVRSLLFSTRSLSIKHRRMHPACAKEGVLQDGTAATAARHFQRAIKNQRN